jgi:hypothetical protein
MDFHQSSSQLRVAATTVAIVCVLAASAFGQDNITITSPHSNTTYSYPVTVAATFSGCGGTSTGFGYSANSSSFITWGQTNTTINNTDYRLTPGTYATIHFKGWSGSPLCEADATNVTITGPDTTTVSNIEDDPTSDWKYVFDTGTSGSASGTTTLVSGSPCQDSQCREFTMSFTDGGGMRGSISFGTDESATNFVYDTYVYLTNPSSLANLEMDNNQVWDSSNDVLIYGTQCASNGYWEYTTNDSGAHWNVSTVKCEGGPPKWQSDYWHHVQIKAHRDGSGNAYYDSVTLDGVTSQLNDSGFSSFALDWNPNGDLLLNFQMDGNGSSGSVTAYVDGLTEIYW